MSNASDHSAHALPQQSLKTTWTPEIFMSTSSNLCYRKGGIKNSRTSISISAGKWYETTGSMQLAAFVDICVATLVYAFKAFKSVALVSDTSLRGVVCENLNGATEIQTLGAA
jgi:hypothetical protein